MVPPRAARMRQAKKGPRRSARRGAERSHPLLVMAALASSGVLAVLCLHALVGSLDNPGLRAGVLFAAALATLFVSRARESLLAAAIAATVWFSGAVLRDHGAEVVRGERGAEQLVLDVGRRMLDARPIQGLSNAYGEALKGWLPAVAAPLRQGGQALREQLPLPATGRSRYLDAVTPRDAELRKLAVDLTRRCDSQDQGCEAHTLLRHVASKVKYVSDPRGGSDYIQSPKETLELAAGDCEDQTILLSSMLESVGVRTLLAFTEDHVYAMACVEEKLPRKWLGSGAVRYTLPEDGRVCYPMEPTSPRARVGQETDHEGFTKVVDPITRQVFPFEKS